MAGKKENVHLKLSEELEGIDAELGDAMDALSATNDRIDAYLNDDGELVTEPGNATKKAEGIAELETTVTSEPSDSPPDTLPKDKQEA